MTNQPMTEGDPLTRGRQALVRGAWEEAVESLDAAVSGNPADPEGWESLGAARMWIQDVDGAIEARQQAYTLYRERGDDVASARVSLDLASDYFDMRGEAAVGNGWLQRARRLVEGRPPSREHALLRVWDAYLTLLGESDPGAAEAFAGEAVTIAEIAGSRDVGVLALALQGLARVSEGRVPEGLSLLDEAVAGAIGGEFSDPQWFYLTCCCMIDACDRVRDYGRSLEWCHRLREHCARWRVEAFLTTCRIKSTGALLWRGEWEAYESELEHARGELSATRPAALPGVFVRLAELRRLQGRTDEALALLERGRGDPLSVAVRAAVALDRDDPTTAVNLLDGLLRRAAPGAQTERIRALELKVRAHVRRNELEEARAAATELAAICGTIGTDALRAAALVAEGVIAVAASEHDAARLCFEDAIHLYDANGSAHEAARAQLDLASTLAALGRRSAAVAQATAALHALEPLGAAAAERARALLTRLEGSDRSVGAATLGTDAAPLTRRQMEVLELVAQGLSDRDIASRLFLSEHTVHRHVANILTRLGAPSRSAAVAQALRGDLL